MTKFVYFWSAAVTKKAGCQAEPHRWAVSGRNETAQDYDAVSGRDEAAQEPEPVIN